MYHPAKLPKSHTARHLNLVIVMALVISLLPFNIPLPGPLSGVGLETVLARTVDPSVAFEQGQAQPTTVDAVQYRVGSFTKATDRKSVV